jgi:hypothetical protein
MLIFLKREVKNRLSNINLPLEKQNNKTVGTKLWGLAEPAKH